MKTKMLELPDVKFPFLDRCNKIGTTLYNQYKKEEKRGDGCGVQMLEWMKQKFWGLVIQDYIKIFNQTWNILNKHGNIGEKNCYTYGDIDVSVWIEKVKYPEDKKVIVSICHCSGADDNTYLFILSGIKMNAEWNYGLDFLCRTVWRRANNRGGYKVAKSKKYPNGWFSWGDDRDVKIPSLRTYQMRDFDFGYGDGRDIGAVFSFCNKYHGAHAENAHWHEGKIPWALRDLKQALFMLKDYEENKCG